MGKGYTQNKEAQIREVERETLAKVKDVLPRYQEMASSLGDYSNDEILAMSAELQDLYYHINQLIQHGTASQGVRPTPERLSDIKYWGEQIQPYNEILTKTALRSDRNWPYNELIARSGHLLNYTFADESMQQAAREVLSDKGGNLVQSRKAARLLLEHRVLSEDDKKSLSGKGEHLSGKAKIEWMATLAGFGIPGDAKIVIDYLESLKFADLDEDQQHNHFNKIVPVLGVLGSLGNDASLLKEPLEKVFDLFQKKAPNYAGRIKDAIKWIETKKPLKQRRAINGSGYLNEKVDWDSVGDVEQINEVITERKKTSVNSGGKENKIVSNDNIGEVVSGSGWDKWPIILIVTFVFGGIFVWVKLKS